MVLNIQTIFFKGEKRKSKGINLKNPPQGIVRLDPYKSFT